MLIKNDYKLTYNVSILNKKISFQIVIMKEINEQR